jgi:predicted alpha/beta-fold hydrolase
LLIYKPNVSLISFQPGLTGGSDDTYVRHMLMRARSKGWRVVVFNSRGCADSPVTTPKVLQIPFPILY